MGCLRHWMMFAVFALAAACGPQTSDNNKNGKMVECTSNADCASGICDLPTNTCQGGNDNSQTNNETNNGTNSSTNNTSSGPVCGDGVVEGNETCDGDCPTSCDDNDACTVGTLSGLAENCTAECSFSDVSACNDGDGCCPEGCDTSNDDDCAAACGNGVLDEGEQCDYGINSGDGVCPVGVADCDDFDACTDDFAAGDVGECSAMCVNEPVFNCENGDGCCPGACDTTNDTDCSPKVGQACARDSDCPATNDGEGICMNEADWRWPGGYCTGGCNADSDCDAGSHCTGRACVPDCTVNDDCRQGYTCYDFFGTGRKTCAPALGTAQETGAECTADADCLGSLAGATCLDDDDIPGGYCISGCEVDADCADGAHCASLDSGGQACLPDCTGDQDCRQGYECFDWLGDSSNTCGPVATGAALIGEACTVLQDCAGGQDGACISSPDWDGGYCVLTGCNANNPCPTDTHCAFIDQVTGEGTCLADCTTVSDCRTNYSCEDLDEDNVTECGPAGNGAAAIGDACTGVYECGGGVDAACFRETSGWRTGYCSLECTSDADCGADAHCGAIDDATGEGFCLKDCTTNGECRADGYACFEWDDSDPPSLECAPAGTGSALTGETCAGAWECAGGAGALCLTTWEAGYCSYFGCTTDADCTAGGHCGFIGDDGQGFCMDTCATDADCRAVEGYSCFDLDADTETECLPEGDGRVGDRCSGFDDCAGREFAACFTDANGWPGGHCTIECTSGNACPIGSSCIYFNFNFSGCLEDCDNNADCRPGYECTPVSGDDVCLPT